MILVWNGFIECAKSLNIFGKDIYCLDCLEKSLLQLHINCFVGISFVIVLATVVTWPLYNLIMVPLGLEYLQTISFILVIASLVQMVEIILKKVAPALYQALGVFLPLITTNCTILGVAINVINFEYNILESAVYAVATALGFTLAMVLFAGIREQLAITSLPKGMKGTPIALITAGLLAMAFMGFSGIDNTLKAIFGIG